MDKLILFSDGSVNTKSKIGFGVYLISDSANKTCECLEKKIQLKCFENTSSTKLELQTLIWALGELEELDLIHPKTKLQIYTDSQNIITLPKRREKLEKNNFRSKNNRLLNNHELYKELFKYYDRFNIQFIKLEGHKKSSEKDNIDKIFTLVDRASRNALRSSAK